jgi:anti-sigma regulatory factor (Ser/Thr protein kinase)
MRTLPTDEALTKPTVCLPVPHVTFNVRQHGTVAIPQDGHMSDLRHDVAAAADARAEASTAFTRHGVPDELAQNGLLVVSELVANAVTHGRPPIRLEVTGEPGRVRIEVHDAAGGTPAPQQPTDTGGRGLRLVAGLARDWGWVPAADGTGKCVWAELAW